MSLAYIIHTLHYMGLKREGHELYRLECRMNHFFSLLIIEPDHAEHRLSIKNRPMMSVRA